MIRPVFRSIAKEAESGPVSPKTMVSPSRSDADTLPLTIVPAGEFSATERSVLTVASNSGERLPVGAGAVTRLGGLTGAGVTAAVFTSTIESPRTCTSSNGSKCASTPLKTPMKE